MKSKLTARQVYSQILSAKCINSPYRCQQKAVISAVLQSGWNCMFEGYNFVAGTTTLFKLMVLNCFQIPVKFNRTFTDAMLAIDLTNQINNQSPIQIWKMNK